jgi:hypothetical protein
MSRPRFLALAALLALTACGGSLASPAEQEVNGGSGAGSSGSSGGRSDVGGPRCAAAPACDRGDTVVLGPQACDPFGGCYERSVCGTTIRCARAVGQCAAYPTCKPGFEEVGPPTCATRPCEQVTACGATILCAPSEPQCDGYPVCAPGAVPVKSSADCPADAPCYPLTACGVTIWCAPQSAPDAGLPSPPPG